MLIFVGFAAFQSSNILVLYLQFKYFQRVILKNWLFGEIQQTLTVSATIANVEEMIIHKDVQDYWVYLDQSELSVKK